MNLEEYLAIQDTFGPDECPDNISQMQVSLQLHRCRRIILRFCESYIEQVGRS